MAAVKVDKATNELLLGPDWTLNIDICDAVNSDHGYVFFVSVAFWSVLNSWLLCHRNNGERCGVKNTNEGKEWIPLISSIQ